MYTSLEDRGECKKSTGKRHRNERISGKVPEVLEIVKDVRILKRDLTTVNQHLSGENMRGGISLFNLGRKVIKKSVPGILNWASLIG